MKPYRQITNDILLVAVVIAVSVLLLKLGPKYSYKFFYEDQVKQTILEMHNGYEESSTQE